VSHHSRELLDVEERRAEEQRIWKIGLLGAKCLEIFGWIGSLAGMMDEMLRLEGVEREVNRQKQAFHQQMESRPDRREDIAYELDKERFKGWQSREDSRWFGNDR
jgi:hypothetical protein